MKKFFLSLVFLLMLLSISVQAQNFTPFRFGLKGEASINWFKSTDLVRIKNSGSSLRFGYGFITEFGLNKFMSFATGFSVTQVGGTLNFIDSAFYYEKSKNIMYIVTSRKYSVDYFDLPIAIKFKTPELGKIKLFAQLGFNTNFKWKAKAIDKVILPDLQNLDKTTEPFDVSQDIRFMKLDYKASVGVEWGLTGSTSLFFCANFDNGLTNTLKKESKDLRAYSESNLKLNALPKPYLQDIRSQIISITAGILF